MGTVDNQKVLLSGHLQNGSAGLARIVTIDETQSLNLTTPFRSIRLASPKGQILLSIFWRGLSIKKLRATENLNLSMWL